MTNIVAVFLKTESGDNYLFLEKDIETTKQMVDIIYQSMETELGCVYDWEIEIIGDLDKTSLSRHIGNRRDIIQDDIENGE